MTVLAREPNSLLARNDYSPGRARSRYSSWRVALAAGALAVLLAMAVTGCGGSGKDDDSPEPPPTPPTLTVSAAQATVAPIQQETVLTGVTVALQHLTLRAPASGRITDFSLQTGDMVRRGQTVARLINREEDAARAGVQVARGLDPAGSAAMAQSVKRWASGPGVPITAPRNAIVADRFVTSGQIVNEFDPIADLVDPRTIYVEATVPIDQLSRVRAGMPATVTSPLNPGHRYPASVAALSPSFRVGGTTSRARVEFASADRIIDSGAVVDVHVVTASDPAATVIPEAALFQDAARGNYYVFVAGSDGLAHRTVVVPGIRTASEVQITQGLKPGDIVITSGGYALSDGLRVKPTLAGS